MNGWTRAIQATMTALAGAAFLALIVVQHNVAQVIQNQYILIERVLDHIDSAEARSVERHSTLMNVCLTMEERMCDTLCKDLRE